MLRAFDLGQRVPSQFIHRAHRKGSASGAQNQGASNLASDRRAIRLSEGAGTFILGRNRRALSAPKVAAAQSEHRRSARFPRERCQESIRVLRGGHHELRRALTRAARRGGDGGVLSFGERTRRADGEVPCGTRCNDGRRRRRFTADDHRPPHSRRDFHRRRRRAVLDARDDLFTVTWSAAFCHVAFYPLSDQGGMTIGSSRRIYRRKHWIDSYAAPGIVAAVPDP